MDGAGGHHHAHHHPYPPNASYHQHPHHHAISQQQQVPPTQSNPAQQAQALVRLYQTAAPGNVSHPYAQAPYPSAAPPATFVQPGKIPIPHSRMAMNIDFARRFDASGVFHGSTSTEFRRCSNIHHL